MEKFLNPAPLGGHIAAIPSKSQAHRLLICAALADIPTEIFCSQNSEDMEATVRCLSALGAEISFVQGCYHVSPIRKVTHGALLDCGESGSTLRFLLPGKSFEKISNFSFCIHFQFQDKLNTAYFDEFFDVLAKYDNEKYIYGR